MKRATILIVDDQPTNLMILGKALKDDYQIKLAKSGVKAMEILLSENPPDLVLLDIIMPDVDGFEVCRQLKGNSDTAKIPIIFITAKNRECDETKGLDLGAVDYIKKPFSIPIVKARVRTHIELKQHRDILENLSTLDGLTGISNRRRFDEYLRHEWKRAQRDRTPISLIMMDIDCFKLYNDNYGHGAGDECLKQIARTLYESAKRPCDFPARYGGEEFACILANTDSQQAQNFAEIFKENIHDLKILHEFSTVSDKVTISLGITTLIPERSTSPSLLLEQADQALYRAKSRGKNRYCSFDSSEKEI